MAALQAISLLALTRRVRELAAALLPAADPTGTYSAIEFDRTSAFLLLCHAEIEWFIEQKGLSVAHTAVTAWSADSRPRSTVIALAAFAHSEGASALPEPSAGVRPKIRQVIGDAKATYSRAVQANNGVKESNLLQLLLPIGIRESQLPAPFLADRK